MQVLQRLALLALGLATTASLWQPTTGKRLMGAGANPWQREPTTMGQRRLVANSDIPGILSVPDMSAGCNSTTAYPAPFTRTNFSVSSNGSMATLHFAYFNLPPDDYVIVHTTKDLPLGLNQTNSFTYRGDEVHTAFFAGTLRTDAITVELVTSKAAEPSTPMLCKGFVVDKLHYVGRTESIVANEEVCGADNSKEAACFNSEKGKAKASGAVIRLLIHKDTGSFFCTGWLVGCEGHAITNNHCISTQAHASSTEFEFNARGALCSDNCETPLGCPGTVRAHSSTLILANSDLDYALVKLDINLSLEYGYLTMRESGAIMSEEIYIPQHPSGWGMRIAAKDDNGIGVVTSLTMGGCAVNQVAYNLDTRAGSSGSPVIAANDNNVVALHHCGGCPNTAINSNKIVADLRARNLLPKCASDQDLTPAPTAAPTPDPAATPKPSTAAPTPPPPAATPKPSTAAPTPPPSTAATLTLQTKVDGTIYATATTTSVDYIDFVVAADGDVELDVLSMEEPATNGDTPTPAGTTFADVNGDCNAAYIDSKIVLFRLNNGGQVTQQDVLATNADAPVGYGAKDGSISLLDSYMYLPLTKGSYRLAIGTAAMSMADAVAKINGAARLPRVCGSKVSNYGNYRVTISATAAVQVTSSPNSYIGSQCAVAAPIVMPYASCLYHKETALSTAVTMDGTIIRKPGAVTADRIPFSVGTFGRVSIEVSSYGTRDGSVYLDVNGQCPSAYVDPVAFLFKVSTGGNGQQQLTSADLVIAADDDDNFAQHTGRHSISFRDPFFSLALPVGSYVLVVGRYPLSIDEAIGGASKTSVDKFTPESCGAIAPQGHYLVTLGTAKPLASSTSPNTFTGSKCTPSDPTSTKSICPL
ncbi:hypothetical protein Gpo141_00008887 [Globisporangium polare]